MIARKVAASLAAGCTVIIKPAAETPYSALALCQFAHEAGVPPGCVNVLTTTNEMTPIIGEAMCKNLDIRKISFTGSTPVGKIILANCADTVKKTQLELGGNAPFIVFDSANVDAAVAGLMACKFRCSGQTCICANRIMVQEGIYDQFISKLVDAMKDQLHVGDGFHEKTTQGPLISLKAVEKVNNFVKDSKEKGGKILLGGNRLEGNFFEPTLIGDVTLNMKVAQEEIFGPIAAIIKY